MFKGYIYKIIGSCGGIYIGSTKNYRHRRNHHFQKGRDANSYSKKLKHPLLFEIIREDNYKLVKTMLLVEQYYIDTIDCINTNRAYISKKYRKKYKKIYNRKYNIKNKESLRDKYSTKIKCIYCNKLITKNNMLRHTKTNKKCIVIQNNILINN